MNFKISLRTEVEDVLNCKLMGCNEKGWGICTLCRKINECHICAHHG